MSKREIKGLEKIEKSVQVIGKELKKRLKKGREGLNKLKIEEFKKRVVWMALGS